MNRFVLGLAGVVIAAVIVLFVMMHGHAGSTPKPQGEPAPAAVATATPVAPPASAPKPPLHAPPGTEDGADAITLPNGEREYTINGVRVRDHGNPRLPGFRSMRRAPQFRPLPPAVTDQVITQIRDAVAACAVQIPTAIRGATPHADAHVELSIAGNRATVSSAQFSLRGIDGDAPEATACMRQRALAATVDAPGVPDERSYPLALSVSLP